LRGAVLVQGMMLAYRVREVFANVPITEAHPKALRRALNLMSRPSVVRRFGLKGGAPTDEHQRDAVLAAVAAKMGFSGYWKMDLRHIDPGELVPQQMWFGPVNYFWPE
jgi:predicted nuclease with RNAse H fold